MSLTSAFNQKGPNSLGSRSTAEEATAGLDLHGKNVLLTGVASGLGKEQMRVLAMRGAHVIGTGRTTESARVAAQSVQGQVTPLACDLLDPRSIRACIGAIQAAGWRLDAIVCNAGIMAPRHLHTVFDHESQFFTNHIAHFMLVTRLLDRLADDGRVVMVSSSAHHHAPPQGIDFGNLDGSRGYSPWAFYGQSKLANLLFAKELARRFAGTRKTANACHPGVIRSGLYRHMGRFVDLTMRFMELLVLKSIAQGAATQTYLAVHPAVANDSGRYFTNCRPARHRPEADDPALAQRLWDYSEAVADRLPM